MPRSIKINVPFKVLKAGSVLSNKEDLYLRKDLSEHADHSDSVGMADSEPSFVCKESTCTVVEEAWTTTGASVSYNIKLLCTANNDDADISLGWVTINKISKASWDFNIPIVNKKTTKEVVGETFTKLI